MSNHIFLTKHCRRTNKTSGTPYIGPMFILHILLYLAVDAAVLVGIAKLLPQALTVRDYDAAVLAALVIGVSNIVLKPILVFLTLPITLVTFGLFLLVINGLIIAFADWLLDGIAFSSIWWAIGASFVLSFVNSILDNAFKRARAR